MIGTSFIGLSHITGRQCRSITLYGRQTMGARAAEARSRSSRRDRPWIPVTTAHFTLLGSSSAATLIVALSCSACYDRAMPSEKQSILEQLVSESEPSDAVAAYYALWHAGTVIHTERRGGEAGLALEAISPFGPLAILRSTHPALVPALLRTLPEDRLYLMAPRSLSKPIQRAATIEEAAYNAVFHRNTQPSPVPTVKDAEILDRIDDVAALVDEAVVARCWTLWSSPRFAEVAVETQLDFRGRGLGRAVVWAMVSRLLAGGITPLYIVAIDNPPSLRLAESLGMTRSREDEFAGYVDLRRKNH